MCKASAFGGKAVPARRRGSRTPGLLGVVWRYWFRGAGTADCGPWGLVDMGLYCFLVMDRGFVFLG